MTASLADRTITALRSGHNELAALVRGSSDGRLTGRSGASEWTVAQVLSHLGSGAEITLAGLTVAVDGSGAPEPDANQKVWDRWNAMTPREQADGFLSHDTELVAAFESLSPGLREEMTLELGFLPFPLSVASFAGMRLNEAALHSWDVRVALDPAAGVSEPAAAVLVEHYAGGLSFLTGFSGRPTRCRGRRWWNSGRRATGWWSTTR